MRTPEPPRPPQPGAPHRTRSTRSRRRTRRWPALAAAVAVGVGLVGAVPGAALAAPSPTPSLDLSPTLVSTTGGSVVEGAVPGVTFTTIAAGWNHTVALGSDGSTYAWGSNTSGQLGSGPAGGPRAVPRRVDVPSGVSLVSVSAGDQHTVAVGSDGHTYAWGRNDSGQLGDGTTADADRPVRVQPPSGVTFTSVAAGAYHTVAVGSDGHTYAWGRGGDGELGDGSPADSPVPVRVQAPGGVSFTAVSAGLFYTVASGSDGGTYAWGYNANGQLGDGTDTSASVPVRVQSPAGVTFTAVDAGWFHTMATGSDGHTYAWGDNSYGKLGDGTTTDSWVPVRANLPTGVTVTGVSASSIHSVATGSDGSAWAWGGNTVGELGDGTTTDSAAPVRVQAPPGTDVTAVSAGWGHTVASGSDGRTYAWGYNASHQLGAGTSTNSSVPVALPSDVQVTSVSFGGLLGVGLTQTGGRWQVITPAGCGVVDVAVHFRQYDLDHAVTYPAALTYGSAPVVTTQPASAFVLPGDHATLVARAGGDDRPTIQWQRHGDSAWEDLTDETDTYLDVTDSGDYRAVFTNCVGETVSATATVTVVAVDLDASSIVADPPQVTVGETSEVVVRVVDTTGAPLRGRKVTIAVDDPTVAVVGGVMSIDDSTSFARVWSLAPGTATFFFNF